MTCSLVSLFRSLLKLAASSISYARLRLGDPKSVSPKKLNIEAGSFPSLLPFPTETLLEIILFRFLCIYIFRNVTLLL